MKPRDYIFWTLLTLASLTLGTWLRQSPTSTVASPLHPSVQRSAGIVERTTYWLALWRLAHGAPQAVPPNSQELPDEVVNAPAVRIEGPDGHPLIAHGDGW